MLVVLVLLLIAFHIVRQGAPAISVGFLTSLPSMGGRDGGIAPFLVSTVAVTTVALATALPIAVGLSRSFLSTA